MSYFENRRNRGSEGNPVSLFPFLAVLLCTMGALISVLLIIARHAQLSADELVQEMIADSAASAVDPEMETFALPHPDSIAEADPISHSDPLCSSEDPSSKAGSADLKEKSALLQKKMEALEAARALRLKEEGDFAKLSDAELLGRIEEIRNRTAQEDWRLEELKSARGQVEKDAQTARIALGATQENRNRLLKEVESLLEALQKMRGADAELDPEKIRGQIAEYEKKVKELQENVEKEENQAKKQNGSYAILPHVGPNGTRRYPMYVECREDGAWLMPENLRLNAIDFEGTLSMENPLEMALSAKRQYLLKNGIFQETPENEQEPYPLLIVRPGGILFLYRVRASLQSWKTEFGYELVEENMPIAYPPNDENLKEEMVRAIHSARIRQRQLASMAPTLSGQGGGRKGKVAYRATPGGAVPVYVDSESPVGRNLADGNRNSANSNENGTPAANAFPGGMGMPGTAETAGAIGANGTHALPHPAERNVSETASETGIVDGSGTQNGSGALNGAGDLNGSGMAERAGAGTSGDLKSTFASQSGSENVQDPAVGRKSTVSAVHDLSQWTAVSPDESGSSGEQGIAGAYSTNAAGASGTAGADGVSGNGASGGNGGPGASVTADQNSVTACVASSEGQNWALENYRPTLSSLNRPVPLECRADALVLTGILDEEPVTIPVTTPNKTAKALAAAIQKKIRSWGEPGRGMYWKPILRVRVAENAQETFSMLQNALQFSGLDLERVDESAAKTAD